jgi:hypothetical protein
MSKATVKVRLVGVKILTQDLGIEADLLAIQQEHSARLKKKEQ